MLPLAVPEAIHVPHPRSRGHRGPPPGAVEEDPCRSPASAPIASPFRSTRAATSGRAAKSVSVFDTTVVEVETDGASPAGARSARSGPFYLPAYGPGARTGIAELGPHLLGLDPRELAAAEPPHGRGAQGPPLREVGDRHGLLGHPRQGGGPAGLPSARRPLRRGGGPLSRDLAGELGEDGARASPATGRGLPQVPAQGGRRPDEDIARIRACARSSSRGHARGRRQHRLAMHQAARVVRAVATSTSTSSSRASSFEECLAVRRRTGHPFVLDETIDGSDVLMRAHAEGAMDVINLKISKVGGLTKARQIRDLCVSLGIAMTIEDSWGGDITTAAIAHLAHSTPEELRFSATDFNSYVTVSTAEGAPKRRNGRMAASTEPGLGVRPRPKVLGRPLVEVAAVKRR